MIHFGKTDVGMKRSGNQDNFGIYALADNATLLVVCDGMGGAAGGERASRLALDAFYGTVKDACAPKTENGTLDTATIKIPDLLETALVEANGAVLREAKANPELEGMGTTLVALFFCDGTAYYLNVGDSRLYGISDGKATQITRDHSYVQMLVDLGRITPEEAKSNPQKNIITRAVGTHEEIEADIAPVDSALLCDGAYFLLCSDGLSNMLGDEEIASVACGEGTLEEKAQKLVEGANEKGGTDNITVVLAQI